RELGRFVDEVKSGARGRVSAANYLATFLLFAKAAGIRHVLLGCDQLEDFAATSTSKQIRHREVERFRDFVLELQPMADMLSIVVTLHPRAQQAIGEMWRLADLPDPATDRDENQPRIVILREIDDPERAKALLMPYIVDARTGTPEDGDLAPFTDDAIDMLLSRSDGKPRDLLRKAHSLIEHGSSNNWDRIDGRRAEGVLDSLLTAPDGESPVPTQGTREAPLEEMWTV